ncbi:NAD(P)H-hydrate dehydratase [Piscinibacter terrae]|uniref:Bifunctional NAD(P)H-hydrate repair enzyme n=1 Tax=Piscinibacter terrae TaxID=2496871 RepID=A0A3N7JRE8_9BURK|nr:NAD(P)H-hydrate dehydratase [Albitalea terrae]RQP23579.1 NAD(P)H-hydrate dehydratase [Albitalea terrae]
MQRVLPPTHDLPLFGPQATRRIEQAAMAALPPHALMRRAGLAVARWALAIAPHAGRIWVAAGPGNNGGDGFEAALHLAGWGKHVSVTFHGDEARLPDDAKDAFARAKDNGIDIRPSGDVPADAELIIDALLGIGANRPPSEAIARCIATINEAACPVLAVDAPSGLDVATGQPLGASAVRASHTISLLTLKPGLFTAHGRDHVGEVWFDDLAVAAGNEAPDAWLTGSDITHAQPRDHAAHKGSFGDVAVIGGAPSMSGAALLAGRSALAAGAGRVYVSLLDDAAPGMDPVRPELMFRQHWWQSPDATLAQTTVVCGCGGGDAVRAALPRVLSASARLVLDADALNAIAQDASLQALLAARAARAHPTVLTPHPLEAARLLGISTTEVQADRLGVARRLAERFHCVALLKGSGTVIASAIGPARINPTGNASLATAGTGDVLAGWLGGLWSQDAQGDPSQVAAVAAWQHGQAADLHRSGPLLASDLIHALAKAR